MMAPDTLYLLFADLFRYPGEQFPQLVKACRTALESDHPEAAEEMRVFEDYISSLTRDGVEELYTKTFDVQPICYLDLGYVIFGEDYKRGAFLLHMKEEQRLAGNDCGTDLPDHLSNILVWITRTHNRALINELIAKILIPGVEKMISEFVNARVDLKLKVLRKLHRAIIQEELNHGNVYRNALAALLLVLKKDLGTEVVETVAAPGFDQVHHQTFFGKSHLNAEINNVVNNYKLD